MPGRKAMRWATLGSCVAMLWGCTPDFSAATRAVADLTRDPSAAQFRQVRQGYGATVCGEVNAKNAFGAYVGFTPFIYDTVGGAYLPNEDVVRLSSHAIAELCTPAGPARDSILMAASRADSVANASLSATERRALYDRSMTQLGRDLERLR